VIFDRALPVEGGGYHFAQDVGGATIAVAVVHASPDAFPSALDGETASATHEIVEAVTDPQPDTRPAYKEADDVLWRTLIDASELADMCQLFEQPWGATSFYNPALYVKPGDLAYTVQRTWSNAAARMGQDPCVPVAPGDVYFNVIPADDGFLQIPGWPAGSMTRAVRVPVGANRTIALTLFSPTGTPGPWMVAALDAASRGGAPSNLSLTLDHATGSSGDVLHLTIAVLRPASDGKASEVIALNSSLGGASHLTYLAVINP
jgi:hypothetical protein